MATEEETNEAYWSPQLFDDDLVDVEYKEEKNWPTIAARITEKKAAGHSTL